MDSVPADRSDPVPSRTTILPCDHDKVINDGLPALSTLATLLSRLRVWSDGLSNIVFIGFIVAALVLDAGDVLRSDKATTTSATRDVLVNNFPGMEYHGAVEEAGYVPCGIWLARMHIIRNDSSYPIDPVTGEGVWHVKNDIEDYLQFEMNAPLNYFLANYVNQPLSDMDRAADSFCVIFQENVGTISTIANLGPAYLKKLQHLELLDWVDVRGRDVTLNATYMQANPHLRIISLNAAATVEETSVTLQGNPPNVVKGKNIRLRLYDGEIRLREMKINNLNDEEVAANQGGKFIADSYLWAYRLGSCNGEYLANKMQVKGEYTEEALATSCNKIVARGGDEVRNQLNGPRIFDKQAAYPQLRPFGEVFEPVVAWCYKIPRGEIYDYKFTIKKWAEYYSASRSVAVSLHRVNPEWSIVLETRETGGVKAGHLKSGTRIDVMIKGTSSTGTYVSNTTALVDVQMLMLVVMLVFARGVRYVGWYLRRINLAYMASRSSVIYVIILQYVWWNVANLDAAVHLTRINGVDPWTNARVMKNVIMTVVVAIPVGYRLIYERRLRRLFMVTTLMANAIMYLIYFNMALSSATSKTFTHAVVSTVAGVSDLEFGTSGNGECYYANRCYMTMGAMPLAVRLYVPFLILICLFTAIEMIGQYVLERPHAHSVNARRASSFRILTCFEKVCLGMSLAEFFRDPSLEYCAKGKNDGRLCVKEEYVTLAGFVIAKDNLIRNRDIFGFWLSELLPVRVLRLPMLSMSASFWPIRDHHVVYGAHCIVKGPLGLPTAQCSCEGALSRRSKALQQSTSKANAAVVHPGNTSGPEPTTEAVHKS